MSLVFLMMLLPLFSSYSQCAYSINLFQSLVSGAVKYYMIVGCIGCCCMEVLVWIRLDRANTIYCIILKYFFFLSKAPRFFLNYA